MSRFSYSYFRTDWGRSSAGRALDWQSRGQGFDSPRLHHLHFTAFGKPKAVLLYGLLAQRLAQGTHNPGVLGSNPGGPTRKTAGQTMCLAFCIKRGRVSTGLQGVTTIHGTISRLNESTGSKVFKKVLDKASCHGIINFAEKHTGDWLRGRAYPSHGWGHKFESCIAHHRNLRSGHTSWPFSFAPDMRIIRPNRPMCYDSDGSSTMHFVF